jgi:predicted amidophosphoribosyltransferase
VSGEQEHPICPVCKKRWAPSPYELCDACFAAEEATWD